MTIACVAYCSGCQFRQRAFFQPPRHKAGAWHPRDTIIRSGTQLTYQEPWQDGPFRWVRLQACHNREGQVRSVMHTGGGDDSARKAAMAVVRRFGFEPTDAPRCVGIELKLRWQETSVETHAGDNKARFINPHIALGLCTSCPRPPTRQGAIVQMTVSAEGTVLAVSRMRGKPEMNEIMDLARSWRFQPYVVSGRAMPFVFMVRL